MALLALSVENVTIYRMTTSEVQYGISILDAGGAVAYESNGLALFETMSGIKSILGTLAIEVAKANDHALDDTYFFVDKKYNTNGSSVLKRRFDEEDQFTITLRDTLKYNLVDSDCVASNVLIDYVGKKDEANRKIKQNLGLVGIELVTDRINFEGVDHDKIPFQVGRGTMRDFAMYYRSLWSNGEGALSPEHHWHRNLHSQVQKARFFGVNQVQLPSYMKWMHKTGSGEDARAGNLYSTVMDAGELYLDGRLFYAAAAMTIHHKGDNMPSREAIAEDFAEKNMKALAAV